MPGPLLPGVVAPDRVLSMGQIEHLSWVQTNDLCKIELFEIELFYYLFVNKWLMFNWIIIQKNTWNHLILLT